MSPRESADERRLRRAAEYQAHIRRIVDAAPPLTDEQRERIAAILRMAERR